MRRRDATGHSIQQRQRPRWPAAASFALSLGVHVALCGLLLLTVPPRGRTQLIRVALLSGNAPGGTPGVASTAPPDPAALAPAAPPAPVAPRVDRDRHRLAKPARRPHRRPTGESQSVTSVAAAASDTPIFGPNGAAADSAAGPGGGNGVDPGSGHGAANGFGSGAGDGSGQRAYCVYCPEPRYPLIARAHGWQGTVHVGLSVQSDGTVEAASVNRSSGYGVLDHAALAVARQSRFSPPATRGLPAPLRAGIDYRFQLSDAQ